MATFDPNAFLDVTTDAQLDTRLPPTPVGEWLYECVEVKARNNPQQQKDPTAAPLVLDFVWESRDPALHAAANRERLRVTQSIFVTLQGNTIEAGEGKNTRLGALRAAVGQNVAGQPWRPRMVVGQLAKLNITHRADKTDPELKYDNVTSVKPPYGESAA